MSSNGESSSTSTICLCLVCSGPSNGICHFGVQCCRACASFFHRSIKERRKYACRWGQNCQISNDQGLRNSCRACRLKKCLEMGMAEEKKRDRRSYPADELNFSSPSDPTIFSHIQQKVNCVGANLSNIHKFADFLRQYNHALRALSVVEGISKELAEEQQVRLISLDEYAKIVKGSILLTYSMLGKYLPSIRQLSGKNTLKLVKLFHNQFLLIIQANLTERAMFDMNSPIGILVPGGIIDKNRLDEHFFTPNVDEKQRQRLTSIIDWHFDFCKKRYRPLLISQLEFAAIMGIIFWNTVEKAHPFLPFEEIDAQRETLYGELFDLIVGQNVGGGLNAQQAAAIRFAKILDLANQLMLHTWEMDEMFTMAKIFQDVHDFWDDINLPS